MHPLFVLKYERQCIPFRSVRSERMWESERKGKETTEGKRIKRRGETERSTSLNLQKWKVQPLSVDVSTFSSIVYVRMSCLRSICKAGSRQSSYDDLLAHACSFTRAMYTSSSAPSCRTTRDSSSSPYIKLYPCR